MNLRLLSLFATIIFVPQMYSMQIPNQSNDSETPPPVPPRTSSLPGYKPNKPLPAIPNRPAQLVQLSEKEEHSIQKIEEDINKIIPNLLSIAKHGVELGKEASVSSAFIQGGPILRKIASTSSLVVNIIKHSDRLSTAKPEVREVAQKRILAITASEQFKTALEELDQLIDNNQIPSIIRAPLQKLANEIKELPTLVVNKFLKK